MVYLTDICLYSTKKNRSLKLTYQHILVKYKMLLEGHSLYKTQLSEPNLQKKIQFCEHLFANTHRERGKRLVLR